MKFIFFLSITILLFNSCSFTQIATQNQVKGMIALAVKPINEKDAAQDKTITSQAATIKTLSNTVAALTLENKQLKDSLAVMVKVLSFDFSYDNLDRLIISPAGVQRIKAEVLKK